MLMSHHQHVDARSSRLQRAFTPLRGSNAWKALPEAEQKAIYADHARINQEPGATPGLRRQAPVEERDIPGRSGPTIWPCAWRTTSRDSLGADDELRWLQPLETR